MRGQVCDVDTTVFINYLVETWMQQKNYTIIYEDEDDGNNKNEFLFQK